MALDSRSLYRALRARDRRFDGVFFVGVVSTGIYCRPVCPARVPMRRNCRFFSSPHEAEQARFRPCLRCRPELAPGNAPIDTSQRIAQLIVERLEAGAIGADAGLEAIAAQFELSSRQVRRIVQQELGAPPVQLLLTRRLLLAKQLLTETSLAVTQVAFASGFSSLRRFNDAFQSRYRLSPSRLRKQTGAGLELIAQAATSRILLGYRPPYDWQSVLRFLAARETRDVEWVTEDFYARTVRLGAHTGWIRVTHQSGKHALALEFSPGLSAALPMLLTRVRALFDLAARPDIIAAHLKPDRRIAKLIRQSPGIRVPGAFSGFELGWRAILGQQVTVRAATTVSGRFAEAFGESIATPFAQLSRLTPAAARVADASQSSVARLGIVGARARTMILLAQAQLTGAASLDGGCVHPEEMMRRLTQIPGIGPWTAHYVAMRALSWPDAFPKEDIAIRNALGGVSPGEAESLSQRWRPWRSYAVMHLWAAHQALRAAG
ncbi:MAG TPA: AlkA N-terminal domain-containing protein [Steroidobacteraceae bacterium]|jgi:AraC family transcriptional regulator of adaptative response / DNA-3-methyladenine glycosylase II|nr:AlkA N-terminal domain-containing protein [Steroidobacteraceae bacterium]